RRRLAPQREREDPGEEKEPEAAAHQEECKRRPCCNHLGLRCAADRTPMAPLPAPPSPPMFPPLMDTALRVEVTRGPLVESLHRVSASVVAADGRLVAGAADPELVTF